MSGDDTAAPGSPLDLDSELEVCDRVVYRELDGEMVLLDLGAGQYYGLDEVGTRAFSLLESTPRLGQIHESLLAEFEVSSERLSADLVELFEDLRGHGLVQLRTEA